MPHELFLTTTQKSKIWNAFANSISTDITLSKAHLSKIIQSGGFLDALLSKLADPLIKVGVPLTKNLLAPLATMRSASAINGVIKKNCVKEVL